MKKGMTSLIQFAMLAFIVCGPVYGPVQAATLNSTTTLIDQTDSSPEAPVVESDQPQFAKVIDDLPLMPGLFLKQDGDVLFAEPSVGRIAETEATGTVDVDDVYRFYRKTLPQMGWKSVDARSFRRESEILRIDVKADGKETTVFFSLKPADK